uniref:endo-1,4-beta-xylanase n=1 Tax=uncultured symbiotic protist of Neotermes koshunensis TaxID=403660 RepID=A4UWZ2_9EUKA|nr:putative glycosyl hydrolase family10 [uncultured symbiotic protist of Neotermes koshunensis]BAF57405.1 putative glycosyl hydrolase family10 [uncultured symbiotic protist of Neotermes koshunensis]
MFAALVLSGMGSVPLAKNSSKFLGNVVGATVPASFDTYWNAIGTANGGEWNVIEATRGRYNFAIADAAANHSKLSKIPFNLHALFYGAAEPGWVARLSAAEQKATVDDFIKAVGARYTPDFVEVAANPVHNPVAIRPALGGDGTTGYDWLVYLYKAARDAFPKAKLLVSEYDILTGNATLSAFLRVVNVLKNQKLVDGIGVTVQGGNLARLNNVTVVASLNSLGGTGLPVYLTSLETAAAEATEVGVIERLFPLIWHNAAVKGVILNGYIPTLLTPGGEEREALRWLKAYLDSAAGKV